MPTLQMKQAIIEIEKDFEKVSFKLSNNGIMQIILKDNVSLFTLADLEETMSWIVSLGDKKYLNLYEGNFASADALVREKAASIEENNYTIADAFVVMNNSDKMIGDFYMQFNKPCKPTKFFEDRNEAIEWLLSQQE